jgi:hypothetical protein
MLCDYRENFIGVPERFVLYRDENLYMYEYQFVMTRSPYERIVGAQKVGGGAFRKVNGDKK